MKSSTLIKILAFLLLIPIAFVGCFKLLSSHIYNKKDCLEFNIDHIEVRTGINIPKVTFADCEMNEKQTNRKATYIIDKTQVDLNTWLTKNKFQKTDSLYLNRGQKKDHGWIAKFDPIESTLVVDISYTD